MENEESKSASNVEQLDNDAEYITGEGMTLNAYIQEQKEINAKKREEAKKSEEKATAEAGSEGAGTSQESEQKEESGEKATDDKSQEPEKDAEEKATAEEGKSQESASELTLEQVKELLGESKLDDVKVWRESHTNREKWNAALSKRAETIPFLQKITPEQWDILAPKLLPYIHGKESIPETSEKFVDETLEGLNGVIPESIDIDFYDEDAEEDKIMTVDKEHYFPIVKKVAGELIKNALPELPVLREKVKTMSEEHEQLKSAHDELVKVNGYLVLSNFLSSNPEHAPSTINDNESPVDALFRIGESGEDHPEYGKWLKFESAAQLSQKRNISFDKAWDTLYGANERKVKREEETKQKLIESQKKEAGEKGGETAQPDPLEKQKKLLPQTYADVVEDMFS